MVIKSLVSPIRPHLFFGLLLTFFIYFEVKGQYVVIYASWKCAYTVYHLCYQLVLLKQAGASVNGCCKVVKQQTLYCILDMKRLKQKFTVDDKKKMPAHKLM